jgi:hypothetical protein
MVSTPTPIVYKTVHQIRFAQLDPYQHMGTEHYGGYARRHGDVLREANMTDRGSISVDFVHLRSGCDSLR